MAEERRQVYICEVCFRVSAEPKECPEHGPTMRECHAGEPGDERSRPLIGPDGELLTRAPRWWVEKYCWWLKE